MYERDIENIGLLIPAPSLALLRTHRHSACRCFVKSRDPYANFTNPNEVECQSHLHTAQVAGEGLFSPRTPAKAHTPTRAPLTTARGGSQRNCQESSGPTSRAENSLRPCGHGQSQENALGRRGLDACFRHRIGRMFRHLVGCVFRHRIRMSLVGFNRFHFAP
eukprot:5544412-Pleurochrysis_carterae.AAC.1